MKSVLSILLVCLLILTTTCKKDTVSPDLDIDAEISQEMKDKGIPSVVACVVSKDGIAWEGAYGMANRKDMIPADRQTLYTIMSISKVFIAVSVMQLVEEGKLDLDTDISQYLPFTVRNPRFPEVAITSRMLMTHTSGIAWPYDSKEIYDFYHLYPLDNMPLIRDWIPDLLLPEGSTFQQNVWKEFRPGTKELYSNIGTSLLALVVEEISGMDYRDYSRENIFDPLGMHNTAFRYDRLNEDWLAIPYMNYFNAYPLFNYRHYPAGNLKTNLEDFSRFMVAILNNGAYDGQHILKPASVEALFDLNNPTTGRALMWVHCPGDCLGHSGGGEGFSARAEWFMDRGKGMFIFSNIFNKSVYPQGRIYELVRLEADRH